MAEDKFKQAQEYQSRGNRLRDIARALAGKSERAVVIQLAEEYDEMARAAVASAKVAVSRAIGEENLDEHSERAAPRASVVRDGGSE